MFLKKFSLPFGLASNSWLISTRFSFWSSLDKRSTNCALTRRIWRFSVKIWRQDPMLMPNSSATSRTVKRRFPRIRARTLSTWSSFVYAKSRPGLEFSPTDILLSLKRLNHSRHCFRLIESSPYAWISNWNVSVKFLPGLQQNFTHKLCSSSSLVVTSWLIRRTACAQTQFSGCSSTTNAHSETGQMAVCYQNLTLGALSSRSALPMLVGVLFKKFRLFLNTPRMSRTVQIA